MRGHGMAVIGPDIVTTVFQAIITQRAANTQRDTILLAALGGADGQPGQVPGRIQYLSDRERRDIIGLGTGFYSRGWEVWVSEVEAAARGRLYQNALPSPIDI